MSNWRVIPTGPMPPYACITCGMAKGPVIDTQRDVALLPNGGRVYQCRECAKLAAELFGFAPGEAYDDLHEAATLLEAGEKALSEARDMLAKKDELIESEHFSRIQVQDENTVLKAQNDQLHATIEEMQRVGAAVHAPETHDA